MTDTVEQTKTYTFEELSPKAKAKALDWWVSALDNDWAEYVIEDAKEQGKAKGFNIEDVRWAGFYSQGDGASWIGRIHIPTFIAACIPDTHPMHARAQIYAMLIEEGWVEPYVNVSLRSTFYVHSGGMGLDDIGVSALGFILHSRFVEGQEDVNVITHDSPLKGAKVRDLAEAIDAEEFTLELADLMREQARDYADDIYSQLRKAYEEEISEEHFAEVAFANVYVFDEDGQLV